MHVVDEVITVELEINHRCKTLEIKDGTKVGTKEEAEIGTKEEEDKAANGVKEDEDHKEEDGSKEARASKADVNRGKEVTNKEEEEVTSEVRM